MITPDALARFRALIAAHAASGLAHSVPVVELAALLAAFDAQRALLSRLRQYEYMIASDYRAHTGRSLADEFDQVQRGQP
jgi:hypothetical protein